jgi:hypothetical protein
MRSNRLILTFFVFFLAITGMAYGQDEYSLRVGSFGADLAADASFLEDEAGISAYGQVSSVNLDLAENAFKNVEEKTDEYIIGSVALDEYGESDDVHVYVDISGWMIAYYLNQEMASKIIDWRDYSGGAITSTKLQDAIVKVTDAMVAFMPEIIYYDFRYPGATSIMIVTDEETESGTTETFRIMIPSTYSIANATWSHYIESGKNCEIKIDGETLHSGSATYNSWNIWEGVIPPSLLTPDLFHEVSLYHVDYYGSGYSNGAIVLIYSQPE